MGPQGTWREVLGTFLRLGLTSFGGPIAHIGYFRQEVVGRRKWLSDEAFGEVVALCQFLPGPASSQIGFTLGLQRAGFRGALAAWAGFTLPSAILMTAFALGAPWLVGMQSIGHGLKLAAVAIVAQAVWGMARSLCPDAPRASIALVALWIALFSASAPAQIATLAVGAVAGLWFCRVSTANAATHFPVAVSPRIGLIALSVYAILLFAASFITRESARLAVPAALYRAGALVFGGGHVVLPLLRDAVVTPGWIANDAFLSGYGAAQAVPGPLFTIGAYIGAASGGVAGAALGLVGIFLPGLLILLGALPFWDKLRRFPWVHAMLRGVNAAVVGILAAALYQPLWITSIRTAADFAVAAGGFVLLTAWTTPPLVVVVLCTGAAFAAGSG